MIATAVMFCGGAMRFSCVFVMLRSCIVSFFCHFFSVYLIPSSCQRSSKQFVQTFMIFDQSGQNACA